MPPVSEDRGAQGPYHSEDQSTDDARGKRSLRARGTEHDLSLPSNCFVEEYAKVMKKSTSVFVEIPSCRSYSDSCLGKILQCRLATTDGRQVDSSIDGMTSLLRGEGGKIGSDSIAYFADRKSSLCRS
jgi:hypothetical protein